MNSRQRVMTALALKEPDYVPFVDWIDAPLKKKLMEAIGAPALDEADFANRKMYWQWSTPETNTANIR